MRTVIARIEGAAADYEPRGLLLAAARSTLASSQLAALTFTPDRALFFPTSSAQGAMRCSGIRGASLWCLAGTSDDGMHASRIIAVLVLVVAASGFRPRWTCVPQWYVTASMAVAMTVPEGGNDIAMIISMLLIPISLGDLRVWHWGPVDVPMAPAWRGSSYAAWWALRVQIAVIYANAAVTKLAVPQWRDGSAMYTVLSDPFDGLPPSIRHLFLPVLSSSIVIGLITWSAMAIELGIAVCALSGRRLRRAGFILACALHAAIAVAMGLFDFSAAMIATAAVLCVGDGNRCFTGLRFRVNVQMKAAEESSGIPGRLSETGRLS